MTVAEPRWNGAPHALGHGNEANGGSKKGGSTPAYPPISSIPSTPAARLDEPDARPSPFPKEPILAKDFHPKDGVPVPATILYFAYGSNMCAKSFLGVRGVRPLSRINVCAPALDLVFNLPGVPYLEPCFANTAIRQVPAKPPVPPVNTTTDDDHHPIDPIWTKGVYGIVYEVTPSDWATIVATEGAGTSYQDLLVPCYPLPSSSSNANPPSTTGTKPFLAHTLYAPPISTPPLNNWRDLWGRLTAPRGAVRKIGHAQPSLRYLNLLRTGAKEHSLPDEYQAYLNALRPYTVTTRRQRWGRILFLGFWAPLVMLMLVSGKIFADEKGRAPGWLARVMGVVVNAVWLSYDYVAKPIFGEGERTIEHKMNGRWEEIKTKRRRKSFASGLRGREEAVDEEKRVLLEGHSG